MTITAADDIIMNNLNIHVSKHPVVSHKISLLRSSATTPASFRTILRELTFHIGYESTSNLTTKPIKLSVPVPSKSTACTSGLDHFECVGHTLAEKVAFVPVLRSGLGMCDAMLELVPTAAVHHIGMYRREMMPVQYYNRLPKKCDADIAYILDPIIATAATTLSVIGILKKWGVSSIHVVSVVGSEEGIQKISKLHPDVQITVGTVDKELTKEGIVLPGLGDAGNRLFGTPLIEDADEEALLHHTKRKRSLSELGSSVGSETSH